MSLLLALTFWLIYLLHNVIGINSTLMKNKAAMYALTLEVINFLRKNSETWVFADYLDNDTVCNSTIAGLKNDISPVEAIISLSGKSFNDIGIEDECNERNMTYLFVEINVTNFQLYYSNSSYLHYYQFLNKSNFFLGLCMFKQCKNLFEKIFLLKDNHKFRQWANANSMNISIYNSTFQDPGKHERNTLDYLLIILVFYLIIRTIITISSSSFDHNDNHDENTITLNTHAARSSLALGDASSNEKSQRNFLTGNKSDHKNSLIYHFLSIFSIRKGFALLFKKTSKYYDEKHLAVISGIRVILLLFISLNNNTFAMTRLPHRDFGGPFFFGSWWFVLIKLGTYSSEAFKAVNGLYFGYKMMSYIKKNNGEFTLKNMIVFFFKILPQFGIVIVAILMHTFILEIGLMCKSPVIFDYFINRNMNYRECIRHPMTILIPFYYQYINPGSDHIYTTCYKSLHFVISEFLCFTFLLIMMYLLMKLKNRRLDKYIYLINLLLLMLSYFSYSHNIIGNSYILSKVYGSTRNSVFPHLFFNIYFLGFNVGLMYFYHIDITSGQPMKYDNDNYIPLYFNHDIVVYLDSKKTQSLHYALQAISIIFMLALSFNFNILLSIYTTDKEQNLLLTGNYIIDIIFIYEGHLFGIFFLLFLVSLLINYEELYIKSMLSSKILLPTNRICFTYFCTQDVVINLIYAYFKMEIYINYQNVVLMSLSLLMINILFSIFLVVLFDLPVRMICKKLANRPRQKVILVTQRSLMHIAEEKN